MAEEITAGRIADFLGLPLHGDDVVIRQARSLDNLEPQSLVFARNFEPETARRLNDCPGILVIAAMEYEGLLSCSHLLHSIPGLAFGRALGAFFVERPEPRIAPTAVVSGDAKLGEGVSIGEYSVIGKGCVIGDHTEIRHHVVLARDVRLGRRCIIRSHCVVGEEGYGPSNDNFNGPIELMPQVGGVFLDDEVELGTFCTINRAALDVTSVGKRTKIAHHVNIGHNVSVGEDVFISSCSELSGRVRVGNSVWIAPCVSVREGLTIGERSLIGIGSNVTRNVEPGKVVMGNPARVYSDRTSRD